MTLPTLAIVALAALGACGKSGANPPPAGSGDIVDHAARTHVQSVMKTRSEGRMVLVEMRRFAGTPPPGATPGGTWEIEVEFACDCWWNAVAADERIFECAAAPGRSLIPVGKGERRKFLYYFVPR